MHDLVIRGARVVDGTGAPATVADVAVDGSVIVAVEPDAGSARQVIEGDGLLLTPGWVDVHTHYDGQVTWDPEVTPSSWHGVTTVVMGNCGVGFAPVRPDGHDFLIELMEGVEDIPGTALHEGIDWQWESFPEYLDALEATPRVMDIAAQVPHAALRAYVMGDRAHDDATVDDVRQMAELTYEALMAGAVGVTTSRTILHRSKHGLVPGTYAPADELLAIGDAIGRAGHGVFQLITDRPQGDDERTLMTELARRNDATVSYSLSQVPYDREGYREALHDADRLDAAGLRVMPQVPTRPTGMLFGLESSLHPFISHPTYRTVADLPVAARARRLADPEIRRRLLDDQPGTSNAIALALMSRWEQIFPLGDPPDYEPARETSAAGVAAREGRRPEEVVLDWLLERDGRALLFAPLASYADFDHEAILEMMTHPRTVLGLGDGGAHCGLICDASMATFLLTHWVRDRTRGRRIPVEQAVHLQTGRTARAYGFGDRGTIEPGKRADLNLVDLDGMVLHAPEMVFDLPAHGRRLVQRVDGYKATMVAGTVTYRDGEPTGERPGRLIRAGR
ncbi:MAG TPA: amidohydrolase family protein [Acidimicrobiales bacterium]|nr:amidohydrolase family protein [Acidimicrobiales bacterium]